MTTTHPTPSDDVKAIRDALALDPQPWKFDPARIARLLARLEQAERDKDTAVLAERERCYGIVMRAPFEQPDLTQDDVDEFGSIEGAWEVGAKSMAFDICTKVRDYPHFAAIASEAKT